MEEREKVEEGRRARLAIHFAAADVDHGRRKGLKRLELVDHASTARAQWWLRKGANQLQQLLAQSCNLRQSKR